MLAVAYVSIADTASAGIHTLSLHDALPISASSVSSVPASSRISASRSVSEGAFGHRAANGSEGPPRPDTNSAAGDRKSTRLNSSHLGSSYADLCLKKKSYRG